MPVPTLYLTWSIIYFLAAISWMYIIRTTKYVSFTLNNNNKSNNFIFY